MNMLSIGSARPRVPRTIVRDLTNPVAYADGRIDSHYRELRQHVPLGLAELDGFDPFWVVTRHADILAVSRQNRLFHNGDRPAALTGHVAEACMRRLNGGMPHMIRSLIEMDAPDHAKYRMLTQTWFKPGYLDRLEGEIRGIARATVESLIAQGGSFDFVAEAAERYPLRIMMQIMGVPKEDDQHILRLTKEMLGAQDPGMARRFDPCDADQSQLGAIPAVIADFAQYFRSISAERKARPRNDLISVIANARIDGAPITELEETSYYTVLATGGHHTTSFAIAGGIQALAENPSEFLRVKNDLSLIPDFVNETLRWTTPVKTFMRSATADTELGGQPIAKGDWLMLCYASGNRDEDVFEDPYFFRANRKPNKYLSLGHGEHMCLGQHLAKLEMRILFEELLPRLDSLQPDGEAKRLQSWFINGLKTLPLRIGWIGGE
jgi:cytochrome P450